MDGGGGDGQWQRGSNLMIDGDDNVIAMGDGGGGAMDSGTAA
jgi:hypothetical protein